MHQKLTSNPGDRARAESAPALGPTELTGGLAESAPSHLSRALEHSAYSPQRGRWTKNPRPRARAAETHYHFSSIADKYKDLRNTDLLPVKFVRNRLRMLTSIRAADIGCGVGRYDIELFRYLGPQRLFLVCIDSNEKMLSHLAANMRDRGFENFLTARARAGALPLPVDSLDALFSFNAIHHFDLPAFLRESARSLRERGQLFIYTRFRSQNERTIWGRFFPAFNLKERRLYELLEIEQALDGMPDLWLKSVEYFRYSRQATLDWLETQVVNGHYSTFSLYENGEFEDALGGFRDNIATEFADLSNIAWDDENTMLVMEKSGP